ncbi:MAG: aminoglycoside 6'-N-acetyltransferase [Bacillota bacterium]|nr:MAG: aminoglycoside 6'-N-acetyltransferase [Bacillota bacterium]MBS3950952.1 GNAT family N-acetyltransferase [Peptococcaceae bacterium]
MQIIGLSKVNKIEIIQELAVIVNQAFPGPDGYPTLEIARVEVLESLGEERVSLVAIDEQGKVAGWIGAIETYKGNAYELHPLVVREDQRGKGIGKLLVEALEERVRELGAMTMYLGTDDVDNGTNIYGKDVYPDPLSHAQGLESTNNHPMAFYRKLGYVVVGIFPDANGFGKPDIFMAKRIGQI